MQHQGLCPMTSCAQDSGDSVKKNGSRYKKSQCETKRCHLDSNSPSKPCLPVWLSLLYSRTASRSKQWGNSLNECLHWFVFFGKWKTAQMQRFLCSSPPLFPIMLRLISLPLLSHSCLTFLFSFFGIHSSLRSHGTLDQVPATRFVRSCSPKWH